ncbi:hypothetical protein EDB92DRAFT_1818751 [Lactarius akahatsu]|uniref:P-type ATPase A domain-containing protein n=1 Tax=Lactarius akahatsu TaxID=416441 RepID=A0AAD4QAE3_9AGAM|nr:hypothetical protein EDB92DRAFT_1818751 [Lactarius akahatsu]
MITSIVSRGLDCEIRDGGEWQIDIHEVIVGDVVLLEPGEVIPCNGVFLSGHNIDGMELLVYVLESRELWGIAIGRSDEGWDEMMGRRKSGGSKYFEQVAFGYGVGGLLALARLGIEVRRERLRLRREDGERKKVRN